MNSFEKEFQQIPAEIKQAWSSSFVFVKDSDKFWHFPARQWSDEQIKEYFLNRYQSESHFVTHLNHRVKQLIVVNHPELLVIVPL